MGIYVKKNFFYFHIFFFMVSNMNLSVSQLQTEQEMTSRIRSHIDYLIHKYILALIS